ncbi:pectate lyase family protein [Roseibium litorale]|uniref:Pectate lyase n=1 Tax=Roseibium litorale TaxID=2803841 RepID=A0ABR9CII0_9HYPH|nr:pectate lyase [Roseibium litorale]MBD8890627.1 pectate lyase [Roseibium litorale]
MTLFRSSCTMRSLMGALTLSALSSSAFALPDGISAAAVSLSREAAPMGWATQDGGTTGGAAADEANVYLARNRKDLIAALGGGNATNAKDDTPRIIFITGTIDLTAGDDGTPLKQEDFAQPGFDFDAYIEAYDPETYGFDKEPEGPLEDARKASQKAQAAHTVIRIGSNKTLIGVPGAKIINGTLLLKEVDNVIIRNITFEDSYDMFPQWDGTDGSKGHWNSEYDLISIEDARRIWIDHAAFSDGARPDETAQVVFGEHIQHHDGLIDIKKLADLITISNSVFRDHDKTHLIGSSDKRVENRGLLKVTFTGNWYDNVRQRMPRVRFGQVHMLGNLFTPRLDGPYPFLYAFGAGKESKILAENNVFEAEGLDAAAIVGNYKGTSLTVSGTVLNGQPVDPVAAFNTANPEKTLGNKTGWTPPYDYTKPDPASVSTAVRATAGPTLTM